MAMSTVNAQEDGIRFGAKAGLNIASLSGDDADGLDSKVGFHIGALVEIPVSEKFAVQPELVYSTQGAESSFNDGFGEVEQKTKLNYLNVPVMAKYYVAEGFSLQAGPQIGFLLSADAEAEFDGESDEVDIKDFVKTVDFGINLGLGYQLEQGIFFDARYNLGVLKIEEDDFDVKNAVFQLSVGYKF